MRISQSFLKDFYKGTCGAVLEAKYITHTYPQTTSDAMAKGKFFEYIATGYIRKGDEPPQAEYYKVNGANYKKDDMKPEYLNMQKHAEIFQQVMKQFPDATYGTEITAGEWSGITDMLRPGAITDLKCSDLLYNRWEEYGWGIEKFQYSANQIKTVELLEVLKQNQALWQPMVYCYIYFKKYGKYPKWYWYIVSSKSSDVVFRELVISESTHAAFRALVPQIENEINMLLNTGGFELKPSYNACSKCLIAETCKAKVLLPEIEIVTL